jgi:hypothetical protein
MVDLIPINRRKMNTNQPSSPAEVPSSGWSCSFDKNVSNVLIYIEKMGLYTE